MEDWKSEGSMAPLRDSKAVESAREISGSMAGSFLQERSGNEETLDWRKEDDHCRLPSIP
jgi:hypothetical protein